MTGKMHATIGKAVDVREDWNEIAAVMLHPEKFRPADVRAYEAIVANNLVDRDGERFTIRALEQLARSLVGKGKLNAHDWRGPGNGRFYRAHVESISDAEAEKLVAAAPEGKFAKLVLDREGARALVGRFFLLADDPQVRHVDAGIARDVSIGFRGAVRRDVTAKELGLADMSPDAVVWRELDDDGHLEALEASIVWVGAQLGAQIRKEAKMDENEDMVAGDAPAVQIEDEEKAEWTTAYINTLEDNCFAVVEPTGQKDDEGRTVPKNARHLPHHPKGKGASGDGGELDMPHFRNALARLTQIRPVTDTISREELIEKARRHLEAHRRKLEAESLEAAEAKIAELRDALAEASIELKEHQDFVAALNDAAGCDLTPEKVKEWKREAELRKEDLVKETLRLAVLCGAITNEEVSTKKQIYEAMSTAELRERIAEYGKLADKLVSVPSVIVKPRTAGNVTVGFLEV